jgi:hypothetical protein
MKHLRSRYLPAALVAATTVTALVAGPAASSGAADSGLMTDLRLVAAARGWTVSEAVAQHDVADRFGRIQQQVAALRPDLYAGATLSTQPGGAPTLYVKGRADASVREAVTSAGIPITLVEGHPLSWLELEARSQELNRRLGALGFRDIVASFDEATAIVEATVTRIPGLPGQPAQILSLLPSELRDRVQLGLVDAPASADFTASGGMWVRDDGVNECTSGWSVTDGGTTGVTTAGHCNGINEINHPGVGIHSLTWQAQHTGSWGDVEWHTSTTSEPASFYASSSDVRDVDAVEPRLSITVGESVCGYGRSSNSRDCSESVYRTSVSVTIGATVYDRLVAMDAQNTMTFGDSGGGWSFSTDAYGSVKGSSTINGSARDTWSVADLYDEALGVSVRTT